MIGPADKQRMAAWLAGQFEGVHEEGGNNLGPIVERFQRVIGKAEREPWCLSFVQYVLHEIDEVMGLPHHSLPATESTQLLWNTAPTELRTQAPEVGTVIIWRKGPGVGHCGIVVEATGDNVITVEGNTGRGDQREGDTVARKRRVRGQINGMTLLGYLRPWGMK
jgi:hypothetical protein